MGKTPDNFLRQTKPVTNQEEFVRLEHDGLSYYLDRECTIRHREGGPARIFHNGCQEFWNNGVLHHVKGAAIVTPMGNKVYYLFGRRLTYDNWKDTKLKYNLDNVAQNGVIRVHENNGDTKS